ncbi:MAG TPA: PIN domain-containing protein [Pyrinomonadaceae bacterium]|nr:PIN domain-containing protein [Pyrinomonadaceae bacterium]
MNAVDTNVLIYAHDTRYPAKRATAEALIQTLADVVLLWQVACEYIAASRKLAPLGFSPEKAWQDIYRLQKLWNTQLPTWEILRRAEELTKRYSFSSWDALIIAACLEGGVTRLYSEDFDASARGEGLEIINPFVTPESI